MDSDESCNIRVICRFRPVNKREIAEGGGIAKQLTFPNPKCVEVAPYNGRPANTFNFDAVFHDPSTTQKEIYDLAANASICDVINGYNSTIFAYGQTGAGKSFTMFGPDIIVPELKGIIPRACMHIFDHIAKDTEGTEYTIKCSFLEIYKEVVRDLLSPSSNAKGLRVREAPNKGVWVEGLHEAYVTCEEDVLALIKQGESHRATSSTDMNASSSRSHSLFILTLHQKTRDGSTKEGRLNLADLAGSEKVGKTGATGNTLEEAKKINQSLSALGNCINALTKSNAKHIPYRDSKLTHILRESLGGNCKTTLLVACSPHIFNLEETVSTLQFAKRAKTIKNSVKVNKQRSVEELMAIIEKLKKELMYFKKYVTILEHELEKVKGPNWKDDLPKIAQATPKLSRKSKNSSNTDDDNNDNKSSSTTSSSLKQEVPIELLSPRSQERRKQEKVSNDGDTTDDDIIEDDEDDEEDEENRVYSNSADMSIKLAGLQVELKKLKEQSQVDINDLKEEVKSLTEENDEIEKKLLLKNELIKERDSEIKLLKEELESNQQAKAILEEKLQYDITQLKLKEDEQKSSINSLTEHNLQLKEKTNNLSQELEDIQGDKDRLKRDHERLSREYEDTKEEIKRKSDHITTLEEHIAQLELTYNSIKQQNTKSESNNKVLQSKLDALESKYSSLQTSSRETETKLRLATSAKEIMETRINDLTGDIESLENELQETRTLLHETREVKQAVQEKGQEKIEELLTQTVPLSDYERIVNEKEKIRVTISDLKSKLNEERSNSSNIRSELEDLKTKFENEKETLQQSLDDKIESSNQQIQLLESKINEIEESKKIKIDAMNSQIESITSQLEHEKEAKQKLEEEMELQYDKQSSIEKQLRRTKSTMEDQELELKQHAAIITSQNRSLEAQAERIKRLETELDESAKDKELLQQEIKTALEINIENAKQFEQQLDNIRKEQVQRVSQQRQSNIRVPVGQKTENRGIIASFFGIKSVSI